MKVEIIKTWFHEVLAGLLFSCHDQRIRAKMFNYYFQLSEGTRTGNHTLDPGTRMNFR